MLWVDSASCRPWASCYLFETLYFRVEDLKPRSKRLQVSWRELKWQWQLNRVGPRRMCRVTADEVCDGAHNRQRRAVSAGVRRRSNPAASARMTRRTGFLLVRRPRRRRPPRPAAGSGLSGTPCRLAAPLRGRHSRREDDRLDRLSRCQAAWLPGAGIDGSRGRLHLDHPLPVTGVSQTACQTLSVPVQRRSCWRRVGSGPRYMICVTHFCTLRESKNLRRCENCACDKI